MTSSDEVAALKKPAIAASSAGVVNSLRPARSSASAPLPSKAVALIMPSSSAMASLRLSLGSFSRRTASVR